MDGNEFPTRFGRARVDEQAITLVNDSPRGRFSALISGRSIARLRLVYAALAAWGLWLAGTGPDPVTPALLLGLGLVGLISSRGHTRDMHLPREHIVRIRAVDGRRWLTVSRLVVHYTRDGVERKRMIQLPGALFAKAGALEPVCAMLERAGYPIERSG